MENNKKRRAVELLKDVLIVFLTLSALWLAAQTPYAPYVHPAPPLSIVFQKIMRWISGPQLLSIPS